MTIRTAGMALTWEYWRRGVLWLAPGVAGSMIACIGLLYATLLIATGLSYADVRTELDTGLIAMVLLPPLVFVMASMAASRRVCVLPVSTSLIVACTLVNGAVASATTYLIVATVLRSVLGASWPLLAPACWAATLYVMMQALMWQVGASMGPRMLVVVLFMFVIVPLGSTYLQLYLLEPDGQFGVTGIVRAVEVPVVCSVVWLLAYFLAVRGVARDRRGDAWTGEWVRSVPNRIWSVVPRRWTSAAWTGSVDRTFSSPSAAQFWFEWRAKGRWIFLAVLVLLLALWTWLIMGYRQPDDVEAVIGGLGGMLLCGIPLIGFYLGSDAGRFERRAFTATRPLSDAAMASVVLKHVAVVVGGCSALWLSGVAVPLANSRMSAHDWQQLQDLWAVGPQSFLETYGDPALRLLLGSCALLLGAWTVMAWCAALSMARPWFVGAGGVGLLALIVSFPVFSSYSRMAHPVFALIWLAGTLAVFLLAYRLHVISIRRILACSVIYLALCALSVLSAYHLLRGEGGLSVYGCCILAGWYALPFAPLAAAPCALSWNRHR